MFNKLYPAYIKTAVAIGDFRQKLERGDADSSGSTLRTLGVVVLVVAVVTALGLAVAAAAGDAAGQIDTGFSFPVNP